MDDIICPICNKEFRSDDCPHSVSQVGEHIRQVKQKKELESFIRKIIHEELVKYGYVIKLIDGRFVTTKKEE